MFGGSYSSQTPGTMSCPRYFIPLNMAEDIKVCVSDVYQSGDEIDAYITSGALRAVLQGIL